MCPTLDSDHPYPYFISKDVKFQYGGWVDDERRILRDAARMIMKDDKLGEAVIRDVIHEGVQDETYTVANLAMQEGKKKVIHRQKIQLFFKNCTWLYTTFWVFIAEDEYPDN